MVRPNLKKKPVTLKLYEQDLERANRLRLERETFTGLVEAALQMLFEDREKPKPPAPRFTSLAG